MDEDSRKHQIVRVSIVGIVANVALSAFKAVIGIISHSIAITLDAVNNLSDAASSAITIVGTKLAGKLPDHAHPFGYGRIEYLTAMIVSAIVLWAGLTSLGESVMGIINPRTPSYKAISLVIVGAGVIVKLVLGRYVSAAGKRLSADALVASGADASFDAIISASTLVAALLYLFCGISTEAWLGVVISIVIIKSGIEMLREAMGKILGARVDSELAQGIKKTACEVEGVRGAFDLFLTDYGPQRLWGSVHVEVDESINAHDVDRITREIQTSVLREHGVVLHTVGIYSANSVEGTDAHAMREALARIVESDPHVVQIHGLYVDAELKAATFDVVVSFEAPSRTGVRQHVLGLMQDQFPDYAFDVVLDNDISD